MDIRDVKRARRWQQNELSMKILETDYKINVLGKYRERSFSLYLLVSSNSATIQDIPHLGRNSGMQRQGFGALLVNTGVQVLYERLTQDVLVAGRMSAAGDPSKEPAATECRVGRQNFWRAFNMKILHTDEHGLGYERICAQLGDIALLKNGTAGGVYPRFISLSEFHEFNIDQRINVGRSSEETWT